VPSRGAIVFVAIRREELHSSFYALPQGPVVSHYFASANESRITGEKRFSIKRLSHHIRRPVRWNVKPSEQMTCSKLYQNRFETFAFGFGVGAISNLWPGISLAFFRVPFVIESVQHENHFSWRRRTHVFGLRVL
jgi:hypothetical protein